MSASVPAGPSGALAGDDGVDRPRDEIRDAGAEGKTSRSVATTGRTGPNAARAGDGEGTREEFANANEDDAGAREANGARGGGAIAVPGAPSATAPLPASGDADRSESSQERKEEEDDENDAEAGDREATSDHDDEAPLVPPGSGAPAVRRRSLRSAANITQEELSSCFHLPSEAACRRLGIGLTVLKRQCRKFGIKRWPFRKMKSLDRLITNVQAGISPGDQNRTLVKSVRELEEQKQRMQECHELDLDDDTKRLQQAYSKANHKARRAAHQTDMGGVGGLLALSGGAEAGLGAAAAAGMLSRQPASGGEKTIAEVLEAAKAQAELLRGVASTIPALLPGAGGGTPTNMAAAVAAAAAAMSSKSGASVSAAAVSALMNAHALRDAGGTAADLSPFAPPTNRARDATHASGAGDGEQADARHPTDAVVGAWSPARPVKPSADPASRGDARLDELLSASGCKAVGEAETARDADEWEDDDARAGGTRAVVAATRGAAAKRERPPGWVETRGRPRKHPRRREEDAEPSPGDGEGDDPLASLAAAALAVKGRGRGRPPGSKNGSGKSAAARGAAAAAPAGAPGVSAVRKSTVTLLVTEHADRVREALARTIDSLTGLDSADREALARGVNEAVGVESLKLRDALNAALAAS